MYGVGVGLYQANLWAATFEVVDPAARATAIGLLNLTSGLLGAWSNPIIGRITDEGINLGNILASLSVVAAMSLTILAFSTKCLLPRDYRGELN